MRFKGPFFDPDFGHKEAACTGISLFVLERTYRKEHATMRIWAEKGGHFRLYSARKTAKTTTKGHPCS